MSFKLGQGVERIPQGQKTQKSEFTENITQLHMFSSVVTLYT